MSRRFVAGQKAKSLPGESLNRAMDLADRWRELGPPPGPGDAPPTADTPVLVVPIKNPTETAFVERGIFGIDQSAYTPPEIVEGETPSEDENEADASILGAGAALEIATPDVEEHSGKWGVTLGPVGPGRSGYGVVSGVVWVRVDVTDAGHGFATLADGDRVYLESSTSGMPILFAAKQDVEEDPGADPPTTPTGKQWCLVHLGGGGAAAPAGGSLIALTLLEIAPATEVLDTEDGIEVTPSNVPDGGILMPVVSSEGSEWTVRESGDPIRLLNYSQSAAFEALTYVEVVPMTGAEGGSAYRIVAGDCVPYDAEEEE